MTLSTIDISDYPTYQLFKLIGYVSALVNTTPSALKAHPKAVHFHHSDDEGLIVIDWEDILFLRMILVEDDPTPLEYQILGYCNLHEIKTDVRIHEADDE